MSRLAPLRLLVCLAEQKGGREKGVRSKEKGDKRKKNEYDEGWKGAAGAAEDWPPAFSLDCHLAFCFHVSAGMFGVRDGGRGREGRKNEEEGKARF